MSPSLRAPSAFRPADTKAMVLSLAQALEMQTLLLAEYSKPSFQEQLRAAHKAAGNDTVLRAKARQELCLPIQGPIISKFGFEASRKGVAQSISAFTPELNADPAIAANNMRLAQLVNPSVDFETDAKMAEDKPAKIHTKKVAATDTAHVAEAPQEGRVWLVVGGAHAGGLLVRRGKELASAALTTTAGSQARLATGAKVKELSLEGDRLHYQRLSGDGPDFGWVSTKLKGMRLLEPVSAEESP